MAQEGATAPSKCKWLSALVNFVGGTSPRTCNLTTVGYADYGIDTIVCFSMIRAPFNHAILSSLSIRSLAKLSTTRRAHTFEAIVDSALLPIEALPGLVMLWVIVTVGITP